MKTLNAKTHINKIKAADEHAKQAICAMLNWNDQQYCEHQFKIYISFLKRRFAKQPKQIFENACYSDIIRGFFNNEWAYRNKVDFLPFATEANRYSLSYICPNQGLVLATQETIEFQLNFIKEEYIYLHSVHELMNNKGFMYRFNNLLKFVI